jgi:cytochrome bd-type quinol oxidase subunit 2
MFQTIKWLFILTQVLLLVVSIVIFFGSLILFYSNSNDLDNSLKRESQRVLLFFCSISNLGTILSAFGIYGALSNEKFIIVAYALIVIIMMFAVIVFVGNLLEICSLWSLFVFASIYVYFMYKYEDVVYDVRNAYV